MELSDLIARAVEARPDLAEKMVLLNSESQPRFVRRGCGMRGIINPCRTGNPALGKRPPTWGRPSTGTAGRDSSRPTSDGKAFGQSRRTP